MKVRAQKIGTVVDDEDDFVNPLICRLSSSSLSSSSRRPSLPRAVSRLFSRSLDPAARFSRYPSYSTSSSSPSSGRKNVKTDDFSLLTQYIVTVNFGHNFLAPSGAQEVRQSVPSVKSFLELSTFISLAEIP